MPPHPVRAFLLTLLGGLMLTLSGCAAPAARTRAATATAFSVPSVAATAQQLLVTSTSTPTASPTPSLTPSPTPSPPSEQSTEQPTDTPAPEPVDTATPAPLPPPSPPPARLIIPRIGVNARVVPVGEDANGAMGAPDNPRDVAWWDEGTHPGDAGSAVVDGHVDFANYGAAVFWNLHLLAPGDTVQVVNAEGKTLTFSVERVASFDAQDSSPLDDLFLRNDQPRLNLVTCAGTFNPRTHAYDKRIVVYTTLVSG